MRPRHVNFTSLLSFAFLLPLSKAILVAPQSQCQVKCGNVLGSTDKADIACGDYMYDTQPGATMKSCVECELLSGYKKDGGISDMQALLYNIRYTANHCIFNDTKVGESPCMTEFACGRFKKALEWNQLKVPTEGTGYEYCEGWDDSNLFKCQNCLGQLGGQHTLFNYMTTLSIACKQRPAVSKTLEIDGSLFDGGPIKAADPNEKNAAIASTFHPPTGLSLAAKIGIAVGGLVAILLAAGCFIVCRGRRKRRAYLENYRSEKEGNAYTGGDMSQIPRWKQKQMQIQRDIKTAQTREHEQENSINSSPHSAGSHAGMTQPKNFFWPSPVLGRGEEHSPISAVEPPMKTWSPYLSPDSSTVPQNPTFSSYFSQVVSPVSPIDQPPKNGQWGAVPIPRAYRRGSLSSMSGRVGECETIEMTPIDPNSGSQINISRHTTPLAVDTLRQGIPMNHEIHKGRMDSVNDFGRIPVARSFTGSVRSGRSGRSFRDRVEGDEMMRTAPGIAGFVPAPSRGEARSPPMSMANRQCGHQRSASNVSVESIGEAL